MTFPERMMTAEGGRAEIFWEFKKNTIRAKWLAISTHVRTFSQSKINKSI
ncbi:MAG: hypothetical protein Q7J59_06685 [Elusimicrobiota bacterium]|nr:hypothetical protein [Elusimicrobiota bacterium]